MAEKTEKSSEKKMEKTEEKIAVKTEEKVSEVQPKIEANPEAKSEASKEKKSAPKIVKKSEAVINGVSLPISKKHSMYICSFIKNKTVDSAIADLQEVIKFKRAVPFKGEIPHRKGRMMSGRYPINASKQFINLLKALRGSIIVNGMDLDSSRIVNCSANHASRPQRRGGGRFKRTHVKLIAKEIKIKSKKEEKN